MTEDVNSRSRLSVQKQVVTMREQGLDKMKARHSKERYNAEQALIAARAELRLMEQERQA